MPTKPFGTPDEAAEIMQEVNGDRGPFRSFEVVKRTSFARTTWDFSGDYDFGAGLAAFSDEELTQALDGQPVGQSVEEIEKQLGAAIDRLVGIQVVVRLPGDVSSNAPLETDNGAVWRLSLQRGERHRARRRRAKRSTGRWWRGPRQVWPPGSRWLWCSSSD